MPMFSRVLWGAALAVCLLPGAELRGRVSYGGLPLPGATVIASAGKERLAVVTDPQGAYVFLHVAEGTWRVKVEMLCFIPQERDITVPASAAGFEMQMRPLAEIAAVAVPTSFQRAEVKQTSKTVSPEVALDAETAAELNQRAADGFLINGSTNNSASSSVALPFAFGNTRARSQSLYNASLGVTVDNSVFDARPYSLTGQNTPKPAYNHLTGMLAFGGPLRIPHLLREGPNFTVNYQWARNRNVTTQSGLVPTLAERSGDLTSTSYGAAIPASRLSPQAQSLLGLYPLPNFTGSSRYNYQLALVGSMHQDSLQTRVLRNVSRHDFISGGFAYQSTRSDSTSLFGFLDTTATTGVNANVNWRHSFTSHVSLSLGDQFSRMSAATMPYFAHRANISGLAGITGNSRDPRDWGPPTLVFSSGISSLTDAGFSTVHNQTNAVSAALLWRVGRHNYSFGADLRRQQFNILGQQNPRGTFTFTGAAAGSDLAGFLLGVPDTSSIAYGNADKYLRSWFNDVYLNDDWRINPGLTLNAGVRWEYGSPVTERYGRLVNLDVAPDFGTASAVVARGQRSPLIYPDRRAVQPRVGVSWRPLPASSTVIRAGYGVYYNTSVYLPLATQMAQQAPLSKSLTVQNSAANPLTLADGFSGVPATTYAVDPHFRTGYAQSWQASVQGELPAALAYTATYLGTKGTRGMQMFLPNTYPSGAANPCEACPAGFSFLASNGNSTRHALDLQLRRRLRNGLAGSFQYTWSKSIDDSALGGGGQSSYVIAQNWRDLRAERGLSAFDQRHVATAQLQYTTGMRGLFREWTAATQINAASGAPQTPVYLAAVSGTGVTGSIRPDYTGAPLYAAPRGLSLNPDAFTAPAFGHWGNAGRNTITGPSQFNLAASLGRVFRLRDRISLDFRVDAANALNHVSYTSWYATINSSQFGLPVSANAMRSVQTTVRARF